jgi:hypothetical protein
MATFADHLALYSAQGGTLLVLAIGMPAADGRPARTA